MQIVNNKLIEFMQFCFAKKECLINPTFDIDIDTHGFIFKPDDRVKGLVVFGDSYPLSNMDCPIDEHQRVREIIQSVKKDGIVLTSLDNLNNMYYPISEV